MRPRARAAFGERGVELFARRDAMLAEQAVAFLLHEACGDLVADFLEGGDAGGVGFLMEKHDDVVVAERVNIGTPDIVAELERGFQQCIGDARSRGDAVLAVGCERVLGGLGGGEDFCDFVGRGRNIHRELVGEER